MSIGSKQGVLLIQKAHRYALQRFSNERIRSPHNQLPHKDASRLVSLSLRVSYKDMSPFQLILRLDSSFSSLLASLKASLRRRKRSPSSHSRSSRTIATSKMTVIDRPVLAYSGHANERKPQLFLRLHLERTGTCLAPMDQRDLVEIFEELTEAYGYLATQLYRVSARVAHLRKSLKALRARRSSMNCRLGINRNIDQYTAELAHRRSEERALLSALDRIAKDISDLGRF